MYTTPNTIIVLGILTFFVVVFAFLACYIAYKRVLVTIESGNGNAGTLNSGPGRRNTNAITPITSSSGVPLNYNLYPQFSEIVIDKNPPEFFEALTYPVISTNFQDDSDLPSYEDYLKQACSGQEPGYIRT